MRERFREAIRNIETELREQRQQGGKDWYTARRARHLYLAYAKFRGVPLEKVETKVREHNGHDPRLVKRIYDEIVPKQVVQVIVRKDLYKGTSTEAQVGHAAFKHALTASERGVWEPKALASWANGDRGTITVLGVKDGSALRDVGIEARAHGFSTSEFKEHDWPGRPEVTAVVIGPDSAEELARVTGRMKLL